MNRNPLLQIRELGQSIWLDYLRRRMLTSGELKQLIDEDGLRGVTSNPKIFEKAIGGSRDYDETIRVLALEGESVEDIYQNLTTEDVQRAADEFRCVYDETDGRDGFVSLEVSPHLAHDTDGTISEARRLWNALNRPNVLIKVPATQAGLPAIEQLIAEGVNVNVTLLFGLPRYRKVAEAYIAGLERRAASGELLESLSSVASFFLSRIDVLLDPILEEKMMAGGRQARIAEQLRGQVAIACAKCAYPMYREIFGGERFRLLAEQGAHPQRLLWASTSTKNPDYSDVKYVEALIGPGTVNTVPPETLDACRDHARPAPRLEEGVDQAEQALQRLPELGIDLDRVTQQLEDEGVEKFIEPFDRLMETLREERQAALQERPDRQVLHLGEFQGAVEDRIASLEKERFCTRLWRKDPSLWKDGPEDQQVIRNALGWLYVAETMEENLRGLSGFVDEVKRAGFRQVVHMGMGGSSLAPLVFKRSFRRPEGGLPLIVLDTTDPATILDVERRIPIERTLFIVASKSGTTAESRAFGEYFYTKVRQIKGDRAGENFVAITDPGTPLAKLAAQRNFRRTFLNMPDIGGRYSALSYFGLIPATLMGVEVSEVLARALLMTHACAGCVPARENPGLVLGSVMEELARRGRDKVTFLMPEGIATLGMWLEQLLAESTGKEGVGLVPIAGEPVGDPSLYGDDRLFIHFRLEQEVAPALEQAVRALRDAGRPVVTIVMKDRLDIAQEFFRWEFATATAGALMTINAFDQPNVQESKDNTKRLLEMIRNQQRLPEETQAAEQDSLRFYADGKADSATDLLQHFLAQECDGDYAALLAYLPEEPAVDQALRAIRLLLRDNLHLATTLGYGPRFLHSTGQLHKGGSNTGLFLQLTADGARDVDVPRQPYTFGTFKRAQALGDLRALREHGRRAVHVHLGADPAQGLQTLQNMLAACLQTPAQV